jgi:hypothetical protein
MRGLALLACLLGGCSLIVDPPDGEHPEVLVNSIPDFDQSNPVAVFAGERFLVVWQDSSLTAPDISDDAIRGRFVSKDGKPLATDLLINDPSTSRFAQEKPRVAASGSNLLVVWTDLSGLGADTDSSIRARVVATTGDFLSGEILVNTKVSGVQEQAAIAGGSDSFMLVWTDASMSAPDADGQAIRGRRIGANGMPEDLTDFLINSTTAGNQAEPSIARGTDERFLAVWTDAPPVGPSDIRGRLLAADGQPLGSDFAINTTLTGAQTEPFVTAMANGGYLVVWTDESLDAGDLEGKAVRARVFDDAGIGVGDDLLLNTTTRGDQGHPYAIVLADGSIFAVFEDASLTSPDTDGTGVRARRLDSTGTPTGDDFLVNSFYGGDQEDPSLAADAAGGVLVVWEDASAPPPDGSGDGVQCRLFAAP